MVEYKRGSRGTTQQGGSNYGGVEPVGSRKREKPIFLTARSGASKSGAFGGKHREKNGERIGKFPRKGRPENEKEESCSVWIE